MSAYDYYSQKCFKAVHKLYNTYKYGNVMHDLQSCFMAEKLTEAYNIYSGPMVWIGIYIAIASLFCIIAMVADLFHGFRNKVFWFPCKYFSLNAASITVIAVAMKLSVDMSSPMPGRVDQAAKLGSMAFMCTIMANLMPSLASMDNKTLLANIIGLIILVITMIVNICIEKTTGVIGNVVGRLNLHLLGYEFDPNIKVDNIFIIWTLIYMVLILMLLIILISSAISIPTSKQILELRYQTKSKTLSNNPPIGMSAVEKHVRKYWVMAKTGSPQFVMASNPLSNASGIICVATLVTYIFIALDIYFTHTYKECESDYKWSMLPIFITQLIGVVVGSIAPIFRYFTVLRLKLFTRNHLVVFKVENYWTQMLCRWKESHLPFLSNAHRSRAIVYTLKNLILSLCIGFQNVVVVSCKMIGLIRIVLIIFVACCSNSWKSLKTLLFTTPVGNDQSNGDLSDYVLQIQDDTEFANITVKDISNSMNRLIQKVKKEQHNDLFELLGKSTGFGGVEKFDIDQVPQLLVVANSWSLPIVTLTCIAIALPNISIDKVESLSRGVGDGFSYTHLVEETLNSASEYVDVRRATMNLWHEVQDSYKWLGNTLERNAFKGKTSEEILRWFADKAREIVMKTKERTHGEVMESFPNKLIIVNSMYRIAETLLSLNYQSNIQMISKKQLFALLSHMISDILYACLTNIPQAILTKCHESVIEKREASVEAAAKLLGGVWR